MTIAGFPRHKEEDIEKYSKYKWWLGMTLGDLLDKTAESFPNKEAVIDDRGRLTYAHLQERVDRMASGLINLGLEKGDCVLLQLPNWSEYVCAYFALQRIGCIPVLLISGYRQLEVSHLARLTEAKAWIVPDAYRKINYVSFIGEVKQGNPQLRHIISVRVAKERGEFTTSLECLLERKLSSGDRERLVRRRPEPTDVAHTVPSGGTTGLPKGIPRTHNDYICNVEYLHKAGEMNTNDVCLLVVPVGHNLALLNIVGSIFFGYKLILLDSTRPQDICSTIQSEKVTFMPMVPSLVRRVIEIE